VFFCPEVGKVASHETLESRVRRGRLYDLYRMVLTEKQRQAYELHDLEDWSLSEVARALEVSRQGAHDLVLRARERLDTLEEQLGVEGRERVRRVRHGAMKGLLESFRSSLPEAFAAEMDRLLGEEDEDSEEGSGESGTARLFEMDLKEDRHV